jgi:DNA-binding NarL/FixJ family response regulator
MLSSAIRRFDSQAPLLTKDAVKVTLAILTDDHTLTLEAVRNLLELRCEVLNTASDAQALVELTASLKPDIVLIDGATPTLKGSVVIGQLKTIISNTKIMCITMNEDLDLGTEVKPEEASEYPLKASTATELIRAIQELLKSRSYVTPKITHGVQDGFIREPAPTEHHKSPTPRQREVMQLLAEGRTLKEVAGVLKVTPRTVAFHKYKVMGALRLKTTADLIRYAVKNHIVPE